MIPDLGIVKYFVLQNMACNNTHENEPDDYLPAAYRIATAPESSSSPVTM